MSPRSLPIHLFALLALSPGASASAQMASTGDVFVCVDGRFMTVRVDAQRRPDLPVLVRQGRATWFPSVLDEATTYAMAEGKGLWRMVSPTALFESVGVRSPVSVLAAIALTESGRKGRYWPWTINHNGQAHYFRDKDSAVAFAAELNAKRYTKFDIGMMQVNWRWNMERFESLAQAFDPVVNIRVADEILQEHLAVTGSMSQAVGRYHSKTPSLKARYLQAVDRSFQVIGSVPEFHLDEACSTG
jgi:hypothetical protein